jgi:hypothetical protein
VLAELDQIKLRRGGAGAIAAAAAAALRQLREAMEKAGSSGGFVRGQSLEVRQGGASDLLLDFCPPRLENLLAVKPTRPTPRS